MILGNVAAASSNVPAGVQTLKVNATAQAFKLLSDGMYSDKIGAILRELGSNAVDSHTAAGCADRPFEVKLPNQLDNRFYVRDFGVGLLPAEVYDLYLTYFASSKQASNDFIGGFGIGSKSPFAYTDSFTLIVAKAGVQTTYAVYLDIDAPKVVQLAEEPATTEWPTGVEVGFAVRPDDFSAFQEKAANLYCWFQVPPSIRGAKLDLDLGPITKLGAITLMPAAKQCPALGHGRKSLVRVGGCLYTIQLRHDEVTELGQQLATAVGKLNALASFGHYCLEAEIGKIQLTGSRESLSFDAAGNTYRYLLSLVQEAQKQLAAHILAPLLQTDLSDWDKVKHSGRRLADVGGVSSKLMELANAAPQGFADASTPWVRRWLARVQELIAFAKNTAYCSELGPLCFSADASSWVDRWLVASSLERKTSPAVGWDWYTSVLDGFKVLRFSHDMLLLSSEQAITERVKQQIRRYVLEKGKTLVCIQLKPGISSGSLLAELGDPSVLTLAELPEVSLPTKTKGGSSQSRSSSERLAQVGALHVVYAKNFPVENHKKGTVRTTCLAGEGFLTLQEGQSLGVACMLGDALQLAPLVNGNTVAKGAASNNGRRDLDFSRIRGIHKILSSAEVQLPVALVTLSQLRNLRLAGIPLVDLADILLDAIPLTPLWPSGLLGLAGGDERIKAVTGTAHYRPCNLNVVSGLATELSQALLLREDYPADRLELLESMLCHSELLRGLAQGLLFGNPAPFYQHSYRDLDVFNWLASALQLDGRHLHPNVRKTGESWLALLERAPLLSLNYAGSVSGSQQYERLSQLSDYLRLTGVLPS